MPKKGGKKKAAAKEVGAAAGPAKSVEEKAKDEELMLKARAMAVEAEKVKQVARDKQAAEDMAKYESFGLSESDIREFREMFLLVDTDNGGSIGKEEVMDLMRMVGYECSEDEVDDMINEIDQVGAASRTQHHLQHAHSLLLTGAGSAIRTATWRLISMSLSP
jgi:hypothetical protein